MIWDFQKIKTCARSARKFWGCFGRYQGGNGQKSRNVMIKLGPLRFSKNKTLREDSAEIFKK